MRAGQDRPGRPRRRTRNLHPARVRHRPRRGSVGECGVAHHGGTGKGAGRAAPAMSVVTHRLPNRYATRSGCSASGALNDAEGECTIRASVPAPRGIEPSVAMAVVVEPDRAHIARELLGVAARLAPALGGHVVAITLEQPSARTLGSWGADRIVHLIGDNIEEDVAAAVAAWARTVAPQVIITGSTAWGREVAPRRGARRRGLDRRRGRSRSRCRPPRRVETGLRRSTRCCDRSTLTDPDGDRARRRSAGTLAATRRGGSRRRDRDGVSRPRPHIGARPRRRSRPARRRARGHRSGSRRAPGRVRRA